MKLITWNIQWGRGADGRVDLDRIIAHAQKFADFDVLCLQEVSMGFSELPDNDGSDQFSALAQKLPGYTGVKGVATDIPHPAGGRRQFGNMILSRYPVKQIFRHVLPWPAEAQVKSMQRMALEVTLETPIGPVRVTTTHLEYYSQRQRQAQVMRLRELHREAIEHAQAQAISTVGEGPFNVPARGVASILTGDFNFLPRSSDRTLMMDPIVSHVSRYCDAWEVAHPNWPHQPTVGIYDKRQWPREPFTFDYIFVSEDLKHSVRAMKVDASTDASDHQPVLLELAV